MTNLIVVMDPEYGDRVPTLASSAPVWIVSSPVNRKSCEAWWKSHPHSDHRTVGAITLYEAQLESRLQTLLDLIPTLETHHGELAGDYFAFPDAFILEVIGLAADMNVRDALRALGFMSFVETAEGFQAQK